MVAGPDRAGAASEADRQRNLRVLNAAALEVFRRGHVPVIGVNLALPIVEAAGAERYDEIVPPLSLALSDRCDAILRVGGPSSGADAEVERVRRRGGRVYEDVAEIPPADVLAVRQTVPLLRIFDVDKAREFYLGFLGFQLDWEHRFEPGLPVYMQVSRAGCVLHLTEHHGDCTPGSTAFVRVTGLEPFHAEITARGYGYVRPGIETAPWHARVMEVTDPFGNRLRFSEDLPRA
jgi:catechol 2,3-dioxygenase-like lactoylglutathione lyase family enzyme